MTGDGLADIISGSYNPGNIWLFPKQTDGTFGAGIELTDKEGKKINVGRRSVPFACDWDGDGDLDLLIGESSGKVFLCNNEGKMGANSFGSAQEILRSGSYASPTVADWDLDGKPDLLVGHSDGSVKFFRNCGIGQSIELAKPVVVLPGDRTRLNNGQKPLRSGGRAFIKVTDWNGDGLPDLLVGDCQFEAGKMPDPPPVDAKTLAKANSDATALRKQLTALAKDKSPEAKAKRDKIMAEYRKVSAILRKARPRSIIHGWTWLYLRKPAK